MKAKLQIFAGAFCAGLIFGVSIHATVILAKCLCAIAIILGCMILATIMDKQ